MTDEVDGVLARLELVGVEAERRSAEIESMRSLPRDLVDALIDTGVFRLTVPTSLGGADTDLLAVVRAVRGLARHDGSTGWVVMTGLLAGLEAARLPRHHAATVLGDPRTIVAGHRGPGGTARRTEDGGLVVTGRWSWGSGVANSTWIGAGVRVVDAGLAGDGSSDPVPPVELDVHCVFRRDQVVVLDTWHAIGLRGTGSTDFQVTEAFVPEGRWIGSDIDAGAESPTAPGPDDLAAVGAAAVAIGLATRAIEEIASRPTAGGVQAGELVRLSATVSAANALIERAIGENASGPGEAGADPVSAALHAVDASVTAIERCYRMGGQSAVLHADPLQRILRDIHVVSQHPAVAPSRWDAIGSGQTDPES